VVIVVTQLLYLVTLIHDLYMLARKVDWVELDEEAAWAGPLPKILLLYPVLREPPETMRTTFVGLAELEYPRDRYRIVAIPNHDDEVTIAALEELRSEFSWLEILVVPPPPTPPGSRSGRAGSGPRRRTGGTSAPPPATPTCRRRRPAS
jgi:hypothetical protein